jgi:hypothetical protein
MTLPQISFEREGDDVITRAVFTFPGGQSITFGTRVSVSDVARAMEDSPVSVGWFPVAEVGAFVPYKGSIYDNPYFKKLTPAQQKKADTIQDVMFAHSEDWQKEYAERMEEKYPYLSHVLHYRGTGPHRSFFGKLFKSIGGAITSVAKAAGVSKVLKLAKKALSNPLISSVLGAPLGIPPGVIAGAMHGIDALSAASTAKTAHLQGKPEIARSMMLHAANFADKAGVSPAEVHKEATRIYRLVLQPE